MYVPAVKMRETTPAVSDEVNGQLITWKVVDAGVVPVQMLVLAQFAAKFVTIEQLPEGPAAEGLPIVEVKAPTEFR